MIVPQNCLSVTMKGLNIIIFVQPSFLIIGLSVSTMAGRVLYFVVMFYIFYNGHVLAPCIVLFEIVS